MKSEKIWNCEPPAHDEAETPISLEQIQEALNSLAEKGLVVPTGELRRGPDGKLYPVYVVCSGVEEVAGGLTRTLAKALELRG